MTLSDFELQQYFQRHGASRGLFATTELLVKLTSLTVALRPFPVP